MSPTLFFPSNFAALILPGIDGPLEFGTTFVNEAEKRVGNLRGQNPINHDLGLGLMRIEECAQADKIGIKSLSTDSADIRVYALKPEWWPKAAPKKKGGFE